MNSENKIANWIVPAGHVARKLSPSSLEGFFESGGVQIEEGTQAAIVINGVVQHEVGPGIYQFERLEPRKLSKLNVPNAITKCLDWMVSVFGTAGVKVSSKGEVQFPSKYQKDPNLNPIGYLPQDITTFSVVICRTEPLEIELGLTSLRGGNRNIAKVSVQITSVISFLRWATVDKDYLSDLDLAGKMEKKMGDRAHQILESTLQGDGAGAEAALQQEWARLGADTGLKIINLLGLASQAQQEVQNQVAKIRTTEELLNVEIRLQKANNQLGLGIGLAEQERQQIEAELEKRGLARKFDLEKFGRDIESQRMVLENSIRVLDQKLKAEIDQEQVELDGKIRARATNLEMDLKRIREIEGAKIDSEADTIRRKSQIELDAIERDKRLEYMKTLMEIRKDRDKASAGIDMEKMKIFKEMTPEQIMLVNPNVSREAATAMAAKFSEDAMKKVAENATDQAKRMQEFLENMAAEQREIVYAANGIRGPGPKRRKEDRDAEKEKTAKEKSRARSDEDDEE